MSVCGYVHQSAGAHGARKRGSESLKLELTGSWELPGTNSRNKLGAFAKAIHIFAAPKVSFWKRYPKASTPGVRGRSYLQRSTERVLETARATYETLSHKQQQRQNKSTYHVREYECMYTHHMNTQCHRDKRKESDSLHWS